MAPTLFAGVRVAHEVAFTNGYPRRCKYEGQGLMYFDPDNLPSIPTWMPVIEKRGRPGNLHAIMIGQQCVDCGMIIKNHDT